MKSTTNYKQIDNGLRNFSTSPRGRKNIAHISQAEAFLLVACLPVACLLVAYCVFPDSFCLFPYTVFLACLPVACCVLPAAGFISSLSHTPYTIHPTPSDILFSIKSVYARASLSLSCARTREEYTQ
jgi:hypothetical protein